MRSSLRVDLSGEVIIPVDTTGAGAVSLAKPLMSMALRHWIDFVVAVAARELAAHRGTTSSIQGVNADITP